MKLLVLLNPSAGGGRAKKSIKAVTDYFKANGADVEQVISRSADHVTELTSQATHDLFDRVVVVGGDGTWHYALNGLAGTGMPAALIPCGRGNDFRRNINLPQKIEEAAHVALNGKIKDLDLVWTGLRHYISVGGVGFDSEVTECANTQIPFLTGAPAYTAAVFYKLFAFKPKWLKVVHDEGTFEGEVMFAVFGNSKSYGGGMKISPYAEMDDGLIDVVIIEKVGLKILLTTLPKVFSGSHLPHPNIRTLRTTRAEISSPDKMDLYGDGEYMQPVPVTLEIRPGALSVVVP